MGYRITKTSQGYKLHVDNVMLTQLDDDYEYKTDVKDNEELLLNEIIEQLNVKLN